MNMSDRANEIIEKVAQKENEDREVVDSAAGFVEELREVLNPDIDAGDYIDKITNAIDLYVAALQDVVLEQIPLKDRDAVKDVFFDLPDLDISHVVNEIIAETRPNVTDIIEKYEKTFEDLQFEIKDQEMEEWIRDYQYILTEENCGNCDYKATDCHDTPCDRCVQVGHHDIDNHWRRG